MTVQSHPQVSRDLMLAARQGLLPARGSGWVAGFGNMFSKELGEWFHTRRWLWQLLLWPIFLGGFIAFLLFIVPKMEAANPSWKGMSEQMFLGLPPAQGSVYMFFNMVVLTGTIGAIILAQDEIIQEKQSGTAAWILSKPAARMAFILTKLLSNIIGVLVFVIAVPAMVVLGEIYLATHQLVPVLPFLAGTGIAFMGIFFYISMVIMLGVVCESRSKLLGIAFGIYFGGTVLKTFIPQIGYVLPIALDGIGLSILMKTPMPTLFISELISVAILTIVFIVVALWRFQHKEF